MTSRQSTSQQKKNRHLNKEILIEQKLKKEDPFEFPMDDNFFDQMHDKIMQAVEKTEIKQQTKWTKTWVFLETSTRPFRPAPHKAIKVALILVVTSLTLGLGGLSLGLFQKTHDQQVGYEASVNQQKILNSVAQAPADWSQLAAVSQSDSDLYAEILNQQIEQRGLDAATAMKDL